MYERILVPVDGSPTANAGLQAAIVLAQRLDVPLRLVHVVDLHVLLMDMNGAANLGDCIDILRRNSAEILGAAEAQARGQGVLVDSRQLECRSPTVAQAILDEADHWRAGLIVMGTHGRRGLQHLMLGSDAEKVLHGALVPVMLVRRPND